MVDYYEEKTKIYLSKSKTFSDERQVIMKRLSKKLNKPMSKMNKADCELLPSDDTETTEIKLDLALNICLEYGLEHYKKLIMQIPNLDDPIINNSRANSEDTDDEITEELKETKLK